MLTRGSRAPRCCSISSDRPMRSAILTTSGEHARGEPRAGYLRAVIAEQRGDRKAAAAALAEVVELVDSTAREWVVGREQMLMLGALGHYELGNRVRAKGVSQHPGFALRP